jgi:hypothetical protein
MFPNVQLALPRKSAEAVRDGGRTGFQVILNFRYLLVSGQEANFAAGTDGHLHHLAGLRSLRGLLGTTRPSLTGCVMRLTSLSYRAPVGHPRLQRRTLGLKSGHYQVVGVHCAAPLKQLPWPAMSLDAPRSATSTGRRLLGRVVKLAIALAVAEALVRYGMSRPIFGRRLEEYGERGWLISQMAQYEAGGGWLHHRFPLEEDPNLGWTNTPGQIMDRGKPMTINAERLRATRVYGHEKPANTLRIEVFGDSFAFGMDVGDDETFAAQLERALDHAEVLNFGVLGYGMDQVLLRFRAEGAQFHPDIVVLNYVQMLAARAQEDFTTWYKPRFVLRGDQLILHGIPVPSPEEVHRTFWLRPRILDLVLLPFENFFHSRSLTPVPARLLEQFAQDVRAAGSRPIFVVGPASHQYGSTKADQPFEDVCSKGEIECIDLMPAFAEAYAAGKKVAWTPPDSTALGHWSTLGNGIVADHLAEYLKAHPVPPGGP